MELRIPRGDPTTLDHSAAVVAVDQFHPRGTEHRPVTTVRIAHGPRSIHLRYDVQDRYVSCKRIGYQSHVWRDSCVEFFVQPRPDKGYFNFETNCGGNLLLRYNWREGKDRKFQEVSAAQAEGIVVRSSLTGPYASDGDEPVNWWLTLSFPIDFMQDFVGPLPDLSGQTWRGNFYKCGDDTPKPHWASWSPVGETLSFHKPEIFAPLVFE